MEEDQSEGNEKSERRFVSIDLTSFCFGKKTSPRKERDIRKNYFRIGLIFRGIRRLFLSVLASQLRYWCAHQDPTYRSFVASSQSF